jgi:hypothetical protein
MPRVIGAPHGRSIREARKPVCASAKPEELTGFESVDCLRMYAILKEHKEGSMSV